LPGQWFPDILLIRDIRASHRCVLKESLKLKCLKRLTKPNRMSLKRTLELPEIFGYGVSSTLGAGLYVVTGRAAQDFAGPVEFLDKSFGRQLRLEVLLLYR